MSKTESRYDLIIIGTGESGEKAIKELREKGKNAYLIDLKPETILTLISQSFQGIQPKDPSSGQSEMNSPDHAILLKKHTVETPAGETTTYTFHAEPLEAKDSMQSAVHSPYEFEPEDDDAEVLEAQQVNYIHPIQIYEKSPFLDKINEQSKKFFQKSPPLNPCDFQPHSYYHLERIELEDDDLDLNGAWKSSSEEPNLQQTQPYTETDYSKEEQPADGSENSFDYFPNQTPVYRERDLKLRKRLANSMRKETNRTAESSSHRDHESSEQQTIRVDPLGFRDLTSMVRNSAFSKKTGSTNYMEPKESSTREKEIDSNTIESFSSRRRTRSHKKNIYPSSIEPLAKKRKSMFKKPPTIVWDETPTVPETHSSSSTFTKPEEECEETPRPRVSEEAQNNEITENRKQEEAKTDPLRENSKQEQEAAKFDSPREIKQEQPSLKQDVSIVEKENETGLKRDDIEFEDAYGGYSSWEEFLTPFSQNSRKRQEIDKIEKRKIALRGLHNLINNLG